MKPLQALPTVTKISVVGFYEMQRNSDFKENHNFFLIEQIHTEFALKAVEHIGGFP